MTIHLQATFPVSPDRLYDVLTEGPRFAAATGQPARIGQGEGAAYLIFGGLIEGRHIELVRGRRIVQAWRFHAWDPGTYSLVRLTLTPEGAGTRLEISHDAYPEGQSPMYPSWREHLSAGWPAFYFETLAKYFAGSSSDKQGEAA